MLRARVGALDFGFYLPVPFVLVGVAGPLGTELMLIGLSFLTITAGWTGPAILPRIRAARPQPLGVLDRFRLVARRGVRARDRPQGAAGRGGGDDVGT